MREIGQVLLVQVQRASLKVGQRPHAAYDPAPLTVVERLLLSPGGAVGYLAAGGELIDVHHAQHPASKNRQGTNGISIGFTRHYQAMRDCFGPHLSDGCAGENILVAADSSFTLGDLGRAIAIHSATDDEIILLTNLQVAAPCVEFSHFAANQPEPLPAAQLQATLQFLDHGRRGFYATLDGRPAAVRAGDRVFVVDKGA